MNFLEGKKIEKIANKSDKVVVLGSARRNVRDPGER